MNTIDICSIDGFKIGNAENYEAATGCTAIICEKGAVGGVDVRGGAPGTRETDLLNPINMMNSVHAVVLSGGSAFGLDAASGVMEYLERKNIGFDVKVAKVPIVCSAVLFDLNIGSAHIRPDKAMGYKACLNAEENYLAYKNSSVNNIFQGNIGAGTGATVGKISGKEYSMKGGLGYFAVQAGDLKIGAIAAINCFGDVVNPKSGKIIAGVLNQDKKSFASTEEIMINNCYVRDNLCGTNTSIATIITNAKLTKSEANKVASMAHNGYGRTIRPAHTMFDGDTIFSLCSGEVSVDVNTVGLLAARVIENSVINAVKNANSLHNIICYKKLNNI